MARASESLEGNDRVASGDARTLEVRYGVNGERARNFRDAVGEMKQVDFDGFPLAPRTALLYLRAVAQVAESIFGQHLNWVSQSRMPMGDRAVYENEVLSRALDLTFVI